ncbi:hypothetical protein ACJX0J_024527, partial [Zea mays]
AVLPPFLFGILQRSRLYLHKSISPFKWVYRESNIHNQYKPNLIRLLQHQQNILERSKERRAHFYFDIYVNNKQGRYNRNHMKATEVLFNFSFVCHLNTVASKQQVCVPYIAFINGYNVGAVNNKASGPKAYPLAFFLAIFL